MRGDLGRDTDGNLRRPADSCADTGQRYRGEDEDTMELMALPGGTARREIWMLSFGCWRQLGAAMVTCVACDSSQGRRLLLVSPG